MGDLAVGGFAVDDVAVSDAGPAKGMSKAQDTASIHVRLKNVTRVFKLRSGASLHAIGPVDLDLTRGEFFSVVGPSGCGKSTLLDVLAGLGPPTSGTVTFEGRELRGDAPDGVGVVFQEDASFPWLSV